MISHQLPKSQKSRKQHVLVPESKLIAGKDDYTQQNIQQNYSLKEMLKKKKNTREPNTRRVHDNHILLQRMLPEIVCMEGEESFIHKGTSKNIFHERTL